MEKKSLNQVFRPILWNEDFYATACWEITYGNTNFRQARIYISGWLFPASNFSFEDANRAFETRQTLGNFCRCRLKIELLLITGQIWRQIDSTLGNNSKEEEVGGDILRVEPKDCCCKIVFYDLSKSSFDEDWLCESLSMLAFDSFVYFLW